MIDTHAHVYARECGQGRDEVIARANQVGIQHILMRSIARHSFAHLLARGEAWLARCYPMMGLRPCAVYAHGKQK